MEWITTKHEKRTAVVKDFGNSMSSSCARGNLIWAIEDEELILFEIRKSGKTWEYRKISEPGFTQEHSSCPPLYLKKTREQNSEWRKWFETYRFSKKDLKKQLSNAFREAESSNKKLVIEVSTVTQGLFRLKAESVVPLAGRHSNGKLYRISLRRIKTWKVV